MIELIVNKDKDVKTIAAIENGKLDETMPQKTLTNITYNPKLDKIKRLFEIVP